MPKKKLTKTQVKKKVKTIYNAMYDLFLDKLAHSNSSVPFSAKVLMNDQDRYIKAFRRIK